MRQAPVTPDVVPKLLEEATQLSSFEPRLPVSFAFVWENRRFAAKVEERRGRVELSVVGDVLSVPYTVESPKARKRLGELVGATRKTDGVGFRISRHQRLQMSTDIVVEAPVTGASIVSGVAKALLRAKPFMILADELGAPDRPKPPRFRRPAKRG